MTGRALFGAIIVLLLIAPLAKAQDAPPPEAPDRPAQPPAEAQAAPAGEERGADAPAADKPAPADEAAGPGERLEVTVKEVIGEVHKLVPPAEGGEEPTWEPVKAGDKLDEKTVIRTGFRSQVVLTFADSSELTVNRVTKMGIDQFRKVGQVTRTRLGVKYGSMRAKVEKARGPNDYTVASPVATLAITGSDGPLGFYPDTGFKTNCNTGHFTVHQGFRSLALSARQGTNTQLAMPVNLTMGRHTPMLGDVFGGLTGSERSNLQKFGAGRAGVGFVPGGLTTLPLFKPPPSLFIGRIIYPIDTPPEEEQ